MIYPEIETNNMVCKCNMNLNAFVKKNNAHITERMKRRRWQKNHRISYQFFCRTFAFTHLINNQHSN